MNKITYTYSGGIYGHPWKLTLNGPAGKKILLRGDANRAHTEIMLSLPGEARQVTVERLYLQS